MVFLLLLQLSYQHKVNCSRKDAVRQEIILKAMAFLKRACNLYKNIYKTTEGS